MNRREALATEVGLAGGSTVTVGDTFPGKAWETREPGAAGRLAVTPGLGAARRAPRGPSASGRRR
jgi:hypothetical protein